MPATLLPISNAYGRGEKRTIQMGVEFPGTEKGNATSLVTSTIQTTSGSEEPAKSVGSVTPHGEVHIIVHNANSYNAGATRSTRNSSKTHSPGTGSCDDSDGDGEHSDAAECKVLHARTVHFPETLEMGGGSRTNSYSQFREYFLAKGTPTRKLKLHDSKTHTIGQTEAMNTSLHDPSSKFNHWRQWRNFYSTQRRESETWSGGQRECVITYGEPTLLYSERARLKAKEATALTTQKPPKLDNNVKLSTSHHSDVMHPQDREEIEIEPSVFLTIFDPGTRVTKETLEHPEDSPSREHECTQTHPITCACHHSSPTCDGQCCCAAELAQIKGR